LAAIVAVLAGAALPVRAQGTRVIFGYTASSDFATLFVAREEGYFSKRNLDVQPQMIPLNPSIPPAIQADSLQMGGPTPSVYLSAVDGGLDQVVIAGAGVTSRSMTGVGFVARAGSAIKTAQDCVGKRIGVPGLGAYLHVGFRAWLKQQGVDHSKVNFIEAAFPQHGDLLRGGSLDGVVTADPFMTRILGAGTGYVVAYHTTFLPEGLPTLLFVASREWVDQHLAAAKAFRDAIVEAAAFVADPGNKAKVRAHVGKYIKLPPEVLATIQISPPGPIVSEKSLGWWVDTMQEQGMLKARPNVSRLILR
jgi:NitT/TauT family transport system substrate-binding protein